MSTSLDRSDERLADDSSPRAMLDDFVRRIRSGDLGMMPVITGLIIIWIVFYTQNPRFLSSRNLVELSLDSATIGMISVGVVLILLLGEIDLSIGSVSGVGGSILAVLLVYQGGRSQRRSSRPWRRAWPSASPTVCSSPASGCRASS